MLNLKELMHKIMGPKEPCKSIPHTGQKKIKINGHVSYADKELIPLLKAMNKVGLLTYSHCSGHTQQNSPKIAWIVLDMENICSVETRKSGPTNRMQLVLTWKR